MVFLCLTKIDDYPSGLLSNFTSKAEKAINPSDASTVIRLDAELDQLQLKGVREFFYNKVVGLMESSWRPITSCFAGL